MPARLDPVHAYQYGKVAVQMQCFDRRPSSHSTSDDLRAILTPLEMALPLLAARVKESHQPVRDGVSAMRFIMLGAVAQRTGQLQVCLIVAPTTSTRFDMLDVQRVIDILLMRPTITTAIASLRSNPCPHGRSDIRHAPEPASQRPRRTASTIASDFSSSALSCSRNRWANST